MLHRYLLIFVFCIAFIFQDEGYASYSPGANISLTGSNSSTQFDIAPVLFGFDAVAGYLDTTLAQPTFSGAFYGTGIGWITFGTGGNTVILDCGAQLINNLSSNCTLNGTGWSENIGDIIFDSVVYNPITGLLEGSADSNIGPIALDNIALPLRPIIFNENTFTATHNQNFTVSGAWKYDGGSLPWNMSFMPIGTADIRNFGGTHGNFSSIDISLATTYELKITDSNGSETTMNIIVEPTSLATTYMGGYYGEGFCISYPSYSKCPDGNVRNATELSQIPPMGSIVADGTSAFNFTLKPRDFYGNRIEIGTMRVRYNTTVKNIQVDPFTATGNINYGPSINGDAFVSTGLGSGIGGLTDTVFALNATDINYSIASNAPTNNLDNIIQLESITYSSGGVDTAVSGIGLFLDFDPLFDISVTTGTPTIAVPHTFEVNINKNNPTTTIVPDIISTLMVNDGVSSEWRSLNSTPGEICAHEPSTTATDPLCDWTDISSIATSVANNFVFTGTYTAKIPSPPLETSYLDTYAHYMLGPIEVLYKGAHIDMTNPNVATQRLQVIGQTGENYGLGSKTRVDAINAIRAKVATLSRNRTNYDDSDIFIVHGNYTIDSSSTLFSGEPGKKPKRAVVTLGGDLTIDTNISLQDYPLAIVSLSNMNNQGGNIIIKGSITDIHSSLIAEHAVISDTSNYQLYVHGSIISANPPKELAPSICPYFVTGSCNASDYDLPNMRAGYISPTNSSTGGASYTHPLIIEGDNRLSLDPPSILVH